MIEAFQSLRDELTAKKQVKVDQTSASASKTGSSQAAVNLDLPPPSQPWGPQILSKWKWTMVLHFHLISVLIII